MEERYLKHASFLEKKNELKMELRRSAKHLRDPSEYPQYIVLCNMYSQYVLVNG